MKPPRLNKGDVIGIVSPARWMEEQELYKTAAVFEQMGFRVKVSPQNFLRQGQFAGCDSDRARAIEEMFVDEDVKAIVCARGGYGALRIIDILNYDLIAKNPKIFIGYSDITALLFSIYKETGLVTFHGPMLYSFINEVDAFTITCLHRAICNPETYKVEFSKETFMSGALTKDDENKAPSPVPSPARGEGAMFIPPPLTGGGQGEGGLQGFTSDSQVRVLRSGIAEGELLGGNLSMLVNLIGTSHDFDTSGKILFIEDVDEYLYNLDRMLLHMKRSGKLENVAGLIIGEMVDIKDNNIPYGKDVAGIILDLVGDTTFPIVTNFPCGHGKNQMTIPISIIARFECNEQGVKLSMLEPPVR